MNGIGVILMRAAYVVIILLLLAIAIPNFVPSRNIVSQNPCVNNLRQIDAAKEDWAKERGKTNGEDVVISEVNTYIRGNTSPQCPQGGVYTYNGVGVSATCSFVQTNRDGTVLRHVFN